MTSLTSPVAEISDAEILLQHLFNNWFRDMDFGKMAAATVVMGVIIFILIMLLQKAWESQD